MFIRRGVWHSCSAISLDHHFHDRPRSRQLFDAVRDVVEDVGGPVRLSIAKTRIGFITGITFGGVIPRKDFLRVGFILRRRLKSPRFVRVDHIHPYWAHYFEDHDESDVDDEVRAWFREAHRVGRGTGKNEKQVV